MAWTLLEVQVPTWQVQKRCKGNSPGTCRINMKCRNLPGTRAQPCCSRHSYLCFSQGRFPEARKELILYLPHSVLFCMAEKPSSRCPVHLKYSSRWSLAFLTPSVKLPELKASCFSRKAEKELLATENTKMQNWNPFLQLQPKPLELSPPLSFSFI